MVGGEDLAPRAGLRPETTQKASSGHSVALGRDRVTRQEVNASMLV